MISWLVIFFSCSEKSVEKRINLIAKNITTDEAKLSIIKNKTFETIFVPHNFRRFVYWPAHPELAPLTGSAIKTNPLLTTPVTTSLRKTSDDGTSNNSISERTQLIAPLFYADDTSNVFLLQFTNPDFKLLTLDGCSSRNTGCTPPSNQRLRRQYSLLYRENSTNCIQSIS